MAGQGIFPNHANVTNRRKLAFKMVISLGVYDLSYFHLAHYSALEGRERQDGSNLE
jgi:hypothetical protein